MKKESEIVAGVPAVLLANIEDGMSLTDLYKKTDVTYTSVLKRIQELQAGGFVDVIDSLTAKRKKEIHLTEKGRRIQEQLKKIKDLEKAEFQETKRIYVLNSFSLNMLEFDDMGRQADVTIVPLALPRVKELFDGKEIISAIGHESTAKVLSSIVGKEVPANRIQIKLNEGDVALVFQIMQRLEEGQVLSDEEIQKLLGEGKIKFFKVRVHE